MWFLNGRRTGFQTTSTCLLKLKDLYPSLEGSLPTLGEGETFRIDPNLAIQEAYRLAEFSDSLKMNALSVR